MRQQRAMEMFRELLSLEEARKIIRRNYKPIPAGAEELPLLEAHNHILAEDVTATLNIPPFNRSTVDGYALKAENTFGAEENNPIKLRICGNVNVGEAPKAKVDQGTATEIVTGAPTPEGADAVIMVEDTERRDSDVYVYSPVAKDENVMKAGEDMRKGEVVLRKGQMLSSREVGILAALGFAKAKVCTVPQVAVLSTGAEIAEPGENLSSGKIYDINAYSLSAAVVESGGRPVYLGVCPDDAKVLKEALRHALTSADIIITSGGVSVGPKDFMPKTLASLGKPGLIICGIAVKPGKPTTVALVKGKLIFALPGHPTSALLLFHLLARPLILALAGRECEEPPTIRALAGMRMFPAKGRRTFIMVRVKQNKANRFIAEPVSTGQSGAITTLAKADGFVEIDERQQFIDVGQEVTVQLLTRTGTS
jgi:putative molybdopterin biosynthesis protein